jgi:hypothetical protein
MATHAFENDPDEVLSAYLDGEVTPAERAAVEERLQNDPAARRLLDSFASTAELCRTAPTPRFGGDLSSAVLAEAARRRAAERAARPLEPAGEFGLPFGRSARPWVWGGVAVAAALMIGFFGRLDRQQRNREALALRDQGAAVLPDRGALATPINPSFEQGLANMRQAIPGLRFVRLDVTPEGQQALERALLQQGITLASREQQPIPSALDRFVEPSSATPTDENQLVMVSADGPRLQGVLSQLEKDKQVFRVEADRASETPDRGAAAPQPAPGGSPLGVPMAIGLPAGQAIRIQLRFTPIAGATQPGPAPTVGQSPSTAAAGPTPVVFVLRVLQQ